MTVHAPSVTPAAPDNIWYVNGSYAGTETGSEDTPYITIAAALAAASSGDSIFVAEGAYVEDLTLVNGVSLIGRGEGLVVVTGTATGSDVGCTIENINFIDDGAGDAFYVTGTLARTMILDRCVFTSTATGDMAFECDNTAAVLSVRSCDFAATTGNANEVVRIEQGTFNARDGSIVHADNTSESLVLEGDAATTSALIGVTIQGQIGQENFAVAPALTVTDCSMTVGAVSALTIAAGCTANVRDCRVSSAEAANNAFEGAGNLNLSGDIAYLGTAVAAQGTLTVVTYESADSLRLTANHWYVDAANAGEAVGNEEFPFATIQDAIDAAAAGDVVHVTDGAYVEDLALADGVDISARSGPLAGGVVITGTCTGTDGSYSLSNLSFIDDTAGGALHFAGTGVEAVVLSGCIVACTGTGDYAMECDNVNLTLTSIGCRFTTAGANANPTVILEEGTFDFRNCDFTHATNTNTSLEAQGDAATDILCIDCRFTGDVDSAAAVVNPTMRLDNSSITVGAVSGINIAAGNTVIVKNVDITSTDAANDAVDGQGTITCVTPLVFLSTADEIAATITATHSLQSKIQHGSYTEAAGADVRAITLPQPFPSANYDVFVTYEDTGAGVQASSNEIDTIAATGFNLTTQVNGEYHWIAIHD